VHNLYLQWLEEGGVAGALIMAALFAVLVWPIVRGGLREGVVGTWARATACAALVFLLHGVTDFASAGSRHSGPGGADPRRRGLHDGGRGPPQRQWTECLGRPAWRWPWSWGRFP
jgi:hypothetical protein